MPIDIDILTFIILTLATHRITRFLVEDYLFDPIRQRIWRKWNPGESKIGYLFTCYWCTSIWAASILVGGYLLAPTLTFVVSLVLSISSIVGYIAARMD